MIIMMMMTMAIKVAFAEKVRFSENLNKLFPKANAGFENNNQKPSDDTETLSRAEMTIPQAQGMFKKLNKGKLPKQLKFLSVGSSGGGSELKIRAMKKIGTLYESNNAFLEYLTTDNTRAILTKNKVKIHLETGSIYCNNINIQDSIYDFLLAPQDETNKIMDYEIDLSDDFDFYLTKLLLPLLRIEMIWILAVHLNFYSVILII